MKNKGLIAVEVIGGLGNQMFQYACARGLSIALGKDLYLDIDDFKNYDLRDYDLDKFNIKANILTKELKSKFPRKRGIKSFFKKKLIYKEKKYFYYDLNIMKKAQDYDLLLRGYFQNENYFKDIREILLKDFTLKKPLSNNTLLWQDKISKFKQNSVSLHVRRGDYVNNKDVNNVHGLCSVEYYYSAVKVINEKVDNPHFFVFSDDIDWCKKNLPLKIEEMSFIDNVGINYEEMYLMSKCKNNIIANSTFSWWSSWLNQNNDKIIIAPKKWMNIDVDISGISNGIIML